MQLSIKDKIILIDDEDYDLINPYSWYISKAGYAAYKSGDKNMLMHRLIMNCLDKKEKVDHINRNTLDNRKINLRLCTLSGQNEMNRPFQKNNTSGYKGVSFNKRGNKFEVYITRFKKRYSLGRFSDPIEAAKAYDKKAKELFGEFAYLNFPEEG